MLRMKMLRGNKSQEFIAQKLGIKQPTYAHYERGDRQADYDTLIKMAEYYHVTIDYILGASNSPNGDNSTYEIELAPEAEDERKMLELYRQVKLKGGYNAAIKFVELLEAMLITQNT